VVQTLTTPDERAARAPVAPDGDPLLSIVIPVYNEQDTLAAAIERVLTIDVRKELVIVDDGSSDRSREILEALGRDHGVHVVLHADNYGKGAALRTGFAHATGDLVLVQDADLEYDPADVPALMAPILRGDADVVYGSRFLDDPTDPDRARPFFHTVGNRWLTWCSNVVTGLDLTDMETCYKCFRRELLADIEIESPRFAVEPELTAKLARRGLRFYEVPIRYNGRGYRDGKKITWRDGVAAMWAIVRYR